MTGPSADYQSHIQQKLKKKPIWVRDPDKPGFMKREYVADVTTEKGLNQLKKDEWLAFKKEQKQGRGLRKTFRPNEPQFLWIQLIAHQLRQLGVELQEPAIEVDVEKTLSALFDEPDRLYEVIRRVTQEDQSQALRALPARYLSERAHRQLSEHRAKLLGWYASRVSRRAQERP